MVFYFRIASLRKWKSTQCRTRERRRITLICHIFTIFFYFVLLNWVKGHFLPSFLFLFFSSHERLLKRQQPCLWMPIQTSRHIHHDSKSPRRRRSFLLNPAAHSTIIMGEGRSPNSKAREKMRWRGGLTQKMRTHVLRGRARMRGRRPLPPTHKWRISRRR